MALLHLNLLGGFQAQMDDGRPLVLVRKKAQALLAYIAVEPAQAHLRDKLAALLWGNSSDQRARHSLRQALFAIKRAIPAAVGTLLLFLDTEAVAVERRNVRLDVAAFEQLVADGSSEALARAAALYRGDFLEGLGVQEPRFEEWLVAQRERLRELALDALAKLLAQQSGAGAVRDAVQTAGRLLAIDPLQEAVHRALMQLYLGQGRRGAALRQYQICVAVLQRELGVEPDATTKRLYEKILRTPVSEPAVSPGRTPDGRAESPAIALVSHGPFVGRDAQMMELRRMRAEGWQRSARIAVVLGEAGIGKSRLIEALVADAVDHGGRVLIGRAHESERILPFAPWVDALRSAGVIDELAREPRLAGTWRIQLARLFPEVAESEHPRLADDDEDHVRLFEAMARAVGHLSERRPLLLVLEDLHCADELSLRLLAFMSRRGAAWPAFLVATIRTEEVADAPAVRRLLDELRGDERFLALTLKPLTAPDTRELVRALSRAETDESALRQVGEQIWRASEGNPFMVVETVRSLYGSDAPLDPTGLPTPPRVRDTIAARLTRLSPRARDLASLASVIGREFDFALLERAAGDDALATAAAVEEMVARHILHAVDERLDFTHDRIREVAYEGLLQPRRRLLHAAVANAMETLNGDPATHYAALSLHCQRGALWDKALMYLRRAGVTASGRGAHRDAVACFDAGLSALEHLPASRTAQEHSIDVRFALRNELAALGEYDAILAHLSAAAATARALGDQVRLGWVSAYLTNSQFALGENASAIASGEHARSIAISLGDVRLELAANLFLGQACHAVGQYRRGADLLRRSVASLEVGLPRRGRQAQQIYTRACLACCLAELGEFEEGLERSDEATQMAEESERSYALVHACFGGGIVRVRMGDLDGAIAVLERAANISREQELPLVGAANGSLLGYAYALAGRVDDALPLLDYAARHVSGTVRFDALSLVHLGEGYLLAGRKEEATALVNRVLALADARGERGTKAWALRLSAEFIADGGPASVESALTAYREAITLASDLGMGPLLARCHLGVARCYRDAGRDDEAGIESAAAAELFRSQGVSGQRAAGARHSWSD
jgi:DNA-binding SARP family transcriptional activator